MNPCQRSPRALSRRTFLQSCAAGTVLATAAVNGCRTAPESKASTAGPASKMINLDNEWLFGGKLDPAAVRPDFNDSGFEVVTLPHCVAKLSWRKWDAAMWQERWIYRRHFSLPSDFRRQRIFLDFEGVTVGAAPVINGHALPEHLGGYLPFSYEITDFAAEGENVLAVAVDGRWLNVPPAGSPRGPSSVDYFVPAGMTRGVKLHTVPATFISDVFAKPVAVLSPERRLDLTCTLDCSVVPSRTLSIAAELRQDSRVLGRTTRALSLQRTGQTLISLTLSELRHVLLWEPANPQLYDVVLTLFAGREPIHDRRIRVGFREARFELDGFFLNGKRLQIFGLNRHELFPYVASAMPARVMRRDAEILRRQFNCNMVRCSHYPQSEHFLDACDELGLMVWEEIPGWQYIGDAAWQEFVVRDVQDLVRRDRNHPSVIIWGVRINESQNNPELYQRTKTAAKLLDDSRPTSGAMNRYSTTDWFQDVYAFDDYHAAADGSVGIREPLPGVPYFLSEAVGQFAYQTNRGFGNKYRRAGSPALQANQALWHAQIHSKAGANARYGGVIAWCAFDYGSPMNSYEGVKCPGVADAFRIPKPGAAFYLAQGDPAVRPVIEPAFYWDFGPETPSGPGARAAIFSNCDRLEVFLDGQPHALLQPDAKGFPHLKHPPFFADLALEGAAKPELRIAGYVENRMVLARSFSADPSQDRLLVELDDTGLIGDGSDATRLAFRVTDKFGAPRLFAGGTVSFELTGPGILVGDNPFDLQASGGVGAIWIKTRERAAGEITVTAAHPTLGRKSVLIRVRAAG